MPRFSCLDLVRCEPRCTWCWFTVYTIKESLLREKKKVAFECGTQNRIEEQRKGQREKPR